jgi:hypothetical protein
MRGEDKMSSLVLFLKTIKSGWRRASRIASFYVLLAVACSQVRAGVVVNLGVLGVLVDPGHLNQQVLAWNQTGQTCTSAQGPYALVCGGVSTANWMVTVDYIESGALGVSTGFASSATCAPQPACGTIVPTEYASLYTLDYGLIAAPTLVTKITFTASLPSWMWVYSQGDPAPSIFYPKSPFTVVVDLLDPSNSAGVAYEDGSSNPYGFITDFLVTGDSGSSVPEPSALALTIMGALALGARRRFRRSDRQA